jgi:SulP family sulfate permease
MKYLRISYPQLKTEILSGLTISLALVPEALSFALLIGVSPSAGLWAAFFMALSTSIFGGRPGIISGATGATAVILASFVTLHGEENLYLAVIIAGIIQFLIWLTNSWKIFKFIPKIVISGFLISLALLILMSQFKYLSIGNLSILQKIIMVSIIGVSALSMHLSSKRFKFPSALTAIIIGSLLSSLFYLPTIQDLSSISNSVPQLTFPKVSIDLIWLVLPYSIGMALSGLTESLIMVDDVCNKLGKPAGSDPKSKETLAQSIGNITSGLFTSIGGCVLVGQTNLNIAAGAKYRISSLIASLGLVSIILVFGKYIQHIPLAGLIGVMLVVVYQTGDWVKLKDSTIVNRLTLIITIVCSIASHNLAAGVILGSISYYLLKKLAKNNG